MEAILFLIARKCKVLSTIAIGVIGGLRKRNISRPAHSGNAKEKLERNRLKQIRRFIEGKN